MSSLPQPILSDTLPTSLPDFPTTSTKADSQVPDPQANCANEIGTERNSETVPPRKESVLFLKEPVDNPMNDNWDEKIEFKQRAVSLHSPSLAPRMVLESPALQPKPTPVLQPSEESFLTFPRSQFRKQSEVIDLMDEDLNELYKKTLTPRQESLYAINLEKEIDDSGNNTEFDKDGFKRPESIVPEQDSYKKQPFETDLTKPDTKVRINMAPFPPESSNFALPPSIDFSPALKGLEPSNKGSEAEEVKPSPLFLFSPFHHPSPSDIEKDVPMVPPELPESFTLGPGYALKLAESGAIPPPEDPNRMIGTLTVKERKDKIKKYLEKRKRRIWRKKICYDCRKEVADKRLRIKGRFVTREQAYAILGTTAEDLSKNELLMKLVKANKDCSIVTSAHNMKVRNIQTLLLPVEEQKLEESANEDKSKLKVEVLKENAKERVVEIKIEAGVVRRRSVHNDRKCELPEITEPVFVYEKVKEEAFKEKHKKYHVKRMRG